MRVTDTTIVLGEVTKYMEIALSPAKLDSPIPSVTQPDDEDSASTLKPAPSITVTIHHNPSDESERLLSRASLKSQAQSQIMSSTDRVKAIMRRPNKQSITYGAISYLVSCVQEDVEAFGSRPSSDG